MVYLILHDFEKINVKDLVNTKFETTIGNILSNTSPILYVLYVARLVTLLVVTPPSKTTTGLFEHKEGTAKRGTLFMQLHASYVTKTMYTSGKQLPASANV